MKVQYVVVDSGPIIKGANLNIFSEHAIMVPGVIKEIKDLHTRERIRNLPPYFLSIQSPSEQSIKHVKSVAIKTGDIKVLSTVDIEVLSLAYELNFTKSHDQLEDMFNSLNLNKDDESRVNNDNHFDVDAESVGTIDVTYSESESDDETENDDLEVVESEEEAVTSSINTLTDDDGWITAENFDEMRQNNFGFDREHDDGVVSIEDAADVPIVGCLTSDYAMQNVLLHMGITILSVNGMIVKEPRIFVTYCRACFHKYRRVDIYFCPHCGNDNVGKVPAKIAANGEMTLFLKKNFQPNLRNKIFSIPTPKGGKHTDGTHYIYCADQRVPDERMKQKRLVVDINEDGEIPFIKHDFATKSSLRGLGNNQGRVLRPTVPRGNPKGNKGRRKK